MPAIGGTAKTQSQNLQQYKRIGVAAGVDRSRALRIYTGIGRGAGVGRGLGVECGRAVGVGLAVAVGVAVGVTLGMAVAVAVGVGVGDAVGVGEGDPTAARISTRPQPTTLFGGPGVPHCL